jgi:capsid portal protein
MSKHPVPRSIPAYDEDADASPWPDDIIEAEVVVVDLEKSSDPFERTIAGSQAEDAKAEEASRWGNTRVVEPLYPKGGLLDLVRNSSSLPSNVAAMANNVDGFGWLAEPALDFDDEGIREQVAVSLYLDAYSRWEEQDAATRGPEPTIPDGAEVTDTIKQWKQEASVEKARMLQHFNGACFESSFVDLRRQTTTDKEDMGEGAWEVVRARDPEGPPRRYIKLDSSMLGYTVESWEVESDEWYWTSPVTYRKVPVVRRFRLIVQAGANGLPARYFREYGDPRIISNKTGEAYDTVEDLKAAVEDGGEEEGAQPAHEILMWPLYFPGQVGGVVRWHGAIHEVRGQNTAASENVDDLENSSIPRGILAVSEGRVGKKGAQKIRDIMKASAGRAKNRMAVLNVSTPRNRQFMPGSSGVKVEFIDLTGAQREDAMFAKYSRTASLTIGQQFRQPPIVRGDTQDFNRATATASLRYTDEQVYQPERNSFDHTINRRILPELGIRFWRFKSKGPVRQDPETTAKIAEILLKQGVVVPAELRPWAERTMGIDLVRTAGAWQQLPLALIAQGWTPERRPSISEEGEDVDEVNDVGGPSDEQIATPPPDVAPPELGVLKSEGDRLREQIAKMRDTPEGQALLKTFQRGKDRVSDAVDKLFSGAS